MASSEYRLELTRLALGQWIELPTEAKRATVDRLLQQIRRDPRGSGALAEAGRSELRRRLETIMVRYALDETARRITVLSIRDL